MSRIERMQKRTPPIFIRLCHWIFAISVIGMVLSGWRIYNAAPIFHFVFPNRFTLGGWLGGALNWHFALMWSFAIAFVCYIIYGLVSGYFIRKIFPLTPHLFFEDIKAVLTLRLTHDHIHYNAIQKLFYIGAVVIMALLIASGLAIWKPVQFSELTALLGGYDTARVVHFILMALVVAYVIIHVAMVILVPSSLIDMIIGRKPPSDSSHSMNKAP